MTKVFLVGEAPLPFQDSAKRPAAGLRTWQFLKSMRDAGHEVRAILFTKAECWRSGEIPQRDEHATYIDRDGHHWEKQLQGFLDEFEPQLVVAVNSLSCERTANLTFRVPFWADINGSPIMEAQAQAWRLDSDSMIPHFWRREEKILKKADAISTCSERQKWATYGLLASLGRINRFTIGQETLFSIPNLTEHWPEVEDPSPKDTPVLRGEIVPQDAIIISSVGAWWNAWLDESTTFAGVEEAMRQDDRIHFVASGGAVPGLTLLPLDNFRDQVEQSEFKDRFHLLGWVETYKLAQIYREIDIAINIDRDCADTRTGARNRLTEWAKFGLPIITTDGPEVAHELIISECAVGVPFDDFLKVTESILVLAKNTDKRKEIGDSAQKYCSENWNYQVGMKEFLQWIENPLPAGDHGHGVQPVNMSTGFWNARIKPGWRYFQETGPWRSLNKLFTFLRRKIQI